MWKKNLNDENDENDEAEEKKAEEHNARISRRLNKQTSQIVWSFNEQQQKKFFFYFKQTIINTNN